jgi:acetyl-CoA carboxylase carboxyl transferase subunit alpha
MNITSRKLRELDVIDEIIPEPLGGAHRNPTEAAGNLERFIVGSLRELKRTPVDTLIKQRYDRWRRMGHFLSMELQASSAVTTG